MSNYVESKKKIEEIRNKDEMMFRMAISHLMDVGIRNLTPKNIEMTCMEIATEDDSRSIMTNRFKCEIVRTAGMLAEIPHIDLLVYVQREVDYDVFDGAILYKRAIGLLQSCMAWFIEDIPEDDAVRDVFDCIGFNDDEIETLGFGYLIDVEEEE